MSEFNWSAYDRWCSKKEWDAEGHKDICNCKSCHDWHVSEGLVEEQFDSPDFPCCTDQMDAWIESKERCPKHPAAYAEPNPTLPEGIYCEECDAKNKTDSR